jgi:hypothetical protein
VQVDLVRPEKTKRFTIDSIYTARHITQANESPRYVYPHSGNRTS